MCVCVCLCVHVCICMCKFLPLRFLGEGVRLGPGESSFLMRKPAATINPALMAYSQYDVDEDDMVDLVKGRERGGSLVKRESECFREKYVIHPFIYIT